jgi:hypothetical protein
LCVNKSQFVPVIFEPPCSISVKGVLRRLGKGVAGGWRSFRRLGEVVTGGWRASEDWEKE